MASHCGFDRRRRQARFFITLDKLDKIGPDGVARELREAGHDARPSALRSRCSRSRRASRRSSLRAMLARLGGAAADGASTASRAIMRRGRRRAAGPASASTSIRRWCAAWATTRGPIFEIRSAGFRQRPSRAAGATIGWSAAPRQDVPATGFSIGFERLIPILGIGPAPHARGRGRPGGAPPARAARSDGHADLTAALAAARRLAVQGHLVSRSSSSARTSASSSTTSPRHGFWGYAAAEASGAGHREAAHRARGSAADASPIAPTRVASCAPPARRPDGPAVRLGPSQARPRPAALHRPARPLRHHPVRVRRRAARASRPPTALRLESVISVTGQGDGARAGGGQPEAADRRDRGGGRRPRRAVAAETLPFQVDTDSRLSRGARGCATGSSTCAARSCTATSCCAAA